MISTISINFYDDCNVHTFFSLKYLIWHYMPWSPFPFDISIRCVFIFFTLLITLTRNRYCWCRHGHTIWRWTWRWHWWWWITAGIVVYYSQPVSWTYSLCKKNDTNSFYFTIFKTDSNCVESNSRTLYRIERLTLLRFITCLSRNEHNHQPSSPSVFCSITVKISPFLNANSSTLSAMLS